LGDPSHYQSLDPKIFGRKWSISLGPQSGRSSIEFALKQIGRTDLLGNKDLVSAILKEVKSLGKRKTPIVIEKEFPDIVDRCVMNHEMD